MFKRKSTPSICLLYTAYHSFIWEKISQNYEKEKPTVINFSKRKTIYTNKTIERTGVSKAQFIYKCLCIALKAKFLKYELILPHPDHLLGNILFFNKNATKKTIIEDGILNYYNYEASNEIKRKSNRRKILTCLTPFRYKTYTGHHSGITSSTNKISTGWFSDPENVLYKEKFENIRKIEFGNPSKYRDALNGHAIFLDQPLESFLSEESAKSLRETTVTFLEERFAKIIIKPHPQHSDRTIQTKNSLHKEFPPHTTIEELITKMQPIAAISYCSTALLNIVKIAPETNCISIGINEITEENPKLSKILELYKINNIEII